ncbi:MAG: CBS domain-containing protein [Anaerolineales bacterium]|nr:CBS domain-containing protein [Anaerolineales bacterium]
MLVKDCMTRHPTLISIDTPLMEAQRIMVENKIRHLPVAGSGKRLLGLVTRQRLAFKPDFLASLNVWEITRYLSSMTVKDVMLKANQVQTTEPDQTVERAAKVMTDKKIGCLPVLEEDIVVGILTEVDLLRSYQVMLGLPFPGVRVTIRMPDRLGELAKITRVLGDNQLGVVSIGAYPAPRKEGFYDAVLKIPRVSQQEIRQILNQIEGQEIIEMRVDE